jgi:putative sugar O-methyltransferase
MEISVGPGYSEYDSICRKAVEDDTFFKNFKRHPIYQQVLEHVSPELGQIYYDKILKTEPELLDCIPDDSPGNPKKHSYNERDFSPSTLRYLGIYLDIKMFFGCLNDLSVAEIGAGYGGQFVILDEFWHMNHYTTYDIPSACALTEKYTSKVGVRTPLTTKSYLSDERTNYDFVMSNFAFTELFRDDQEKYIAYIIHDTSMGFMIVNTEQGLTFKEMLDRIPGSRLIKGITGNDHFIIWGD